MEYTKELEGMQCVGCIHHENAPIPQEGKFEHVKEVNQISGFSHSVGTCGLKQGACKLSLNIKNGIIQEALIAVSYTHLDVYKRQVLFPLYCPAWFWR